MYHVFAKRKKYSEMLEPILAEDSTFMKLAPSLSGILKYLDEHATHHDYMVALLIVLLAESGFYLPSTDSDNLQRPNLRSLRIPKDWKSQETGIYEMYFQLQNVQNINCKLIVVPLGDVLVLNFFPLTQGKVTYTMSIRTLKYVNPYSSDLCGRYIHLKAMSHRFKNELSTPVRSDVLYEAKVMGPSLQALPTELKIKIFVMLDFYSLIRIARCNSHFYEVYKQARVRRLKTKSG
ncbi:F-box only protein 7-like [Ceratina calcarata]|uniref:F-box only protein 7-like n=1 Tax=Ceratina calcarata TaxID=156304 RepID=A0AAJ7J2B0_9HYME|nr:F-box only protein 7-like [Ceratina calcarata]